MPNILVSTFGGTWAVGAELIALSAYPEIDLLANNSSIQKFYENHLSFNNEKIDEVWFICTQGERTNRAIETLGKWAAQFDKEKLPLIQFLSLEKLEDLTTHKECNYMSDFIYRAVLKAREYKRAGKLFLSLTGGRKTMSTDMQRAADLFGCNLLFHLTEDDFKISRIEDFRHVLEKEEANKIFVVEVLNNKKSHFITEIAPAIKSSDYPVEFTRSNKLTIKLFNEINKRLTQSESLLFNAYRIRTDKANQSIFHGLQQLSPSKFQQLSEETPDENWLKALPKADLHFHFGGTLSAAEMIEVALANRDDIEYYLNTNQKFHEWLKSVKNAVKKNNDEFLRPYITEKKKLREEMFSDEAIKPPVVVAAFITAFEGKADYLDNLIFGKNSNPENFKNIGIVAYEQLGDLQGSALLQSRASIEKSCILLLEYCEKENLKYLEVRCSPCNYTKGGLSALEVIQIMYDKLYKKSSCDIRVILIGSRHGDNAVFDCHVQLAIEMSKDKKLRDFIVGFDVAGDESKAKPATMRDALRPLMLESLHITIHAGENQPVNNIWQATYELNADRIGHGLTLVDNKKLMSRFRDRNIFIELCPSSNYQISDFGAGSKDYPLREFLQNGIKVTLNTDNTGISRTTITNEYLFMVSETQLSKMEVLQLLRNSFQGAFLPKNKKKKLLIEVENKLYKMISEEDNF